jgi:hypothetical protein
MDKITTKCPDRSPLAIAEAIKGIISFKTVCDIGCREGDIMIAFSQYADKVIGIDWSSENVKVAVEKGLDVRHLTLKDEFPIADVYYVWVSKILNIEILNKITSGIVILGGDPSVGEVYNVGGKLIKVPYNEGKGERQSGIFELTVIDKNSKQGDVKDEPRKEITIDFIRSADPQPDAVVSRVPAKSVKPKPKGNRSNNSR